MVTSLPRNIQLKLEHTLGQWRRWQCDPPLPQAPEVVSVMTHGLSNFSVLVAVGGHCGQQRYVVRIDGINPAGNGLNRQAEWRVMQSAHNAGLSPQPRYFNPELGSLVCDYLPPDEQQPLAIGELATLLRRIHQLPPRHHRLELAERILGYEKQLQHRGTPPAGELAQCREQIPGLLQRISETQQPNVLCHNDLLRANRIYSGKRLWAIDWEYSAMGSPWFDLAVTATGDDLDSAQREELLETYLQRPVHADDHQQLQLHSCIYRYLEILWYQAVEHPEFDELALQSRLAQLGADLEQL
jgi:thiamine kinase